MIGMVKVLPLFTFRKCRNCGHQIQAIDEAQDTCMGCHINLDVLYPVEVS